MGNTSILAGMRIVDMTTVIFGPYATNTLAGLGADVVKIEPASGDEVRRVGTPAVTRGMGPCHMTINRGKRSVVWDLKAPQGQEAMRRLLSGADVFIHNLRAEAIGRLGLEYPEVRALKPDIVYAHCTGFGSGGPYAGLVAYDDTIQAASGAASLLPRADGNPAPRFLPSALADKVSGLHAVYAVLAALLHRERTGDGQVVEIPMFETFTHMLLVEHLYGETFVPPNAPAGYPRQLDPARQPMRTQDGYVTVSPYTDERWQRFFEETGHASFLSDHDLNSARARHAASGLMHQQMAKILRERPTLYWLDFLSSIDIPVFPVSDLQDLLADAQLRSGGFFTEADHPTEGRYRYSDVPVKFAVPAAAPLRPAPLLGEHSEEVLRELGLAE